MKTYLKTLPITLIVLLFLVGLTANAATIKGGEEYTLPKEEVINDDLYVGGGSLFILGEVNGDVIVGGGNVLISGYIHDDVVVAGGNINILGVVDDDVRAVGGNIVIGENVAGDIVVAGGNIQILSNVVVGGDVVMVGGRLVVDGNVLGDVRMTGGEIQINGTVEGEVNIDFADKVIVGDSSVVNGNLSYKSINEAEIAEGALIRGEIVFDQSKSGMVNGYLKASLAGIFGVLILLKFLTLLVLGVLAVILFKNFSFSMAEDSLERFGKEFVRGLVVFVAVPIISFLLFATIFGFYVAVIVLLLYGTLSVVAGVYTGVLLGALLAKLIKKQVIVDWKWTLLGVIALTIIGIIPFIGWIIAAVFYLTSLGYMSGIVYQKFWVQR